MERELWYLFAGSEGAHTRLEIARLLLSEPRNANRLAEAVGVDYTTVRYHLEVLCDRGVVEAGDRGYGRRYAPTDAFEAHEATFERIAETVAPDR